MAQIATSIRASNRLKYRSGFGLDSAKFIFSGLAPGQVFRRLILKVQFRLKLKIRWFIWFRFAEAKV